MATANNNFRKYSVSFEAPYLHAFHIAPSDSANLVHTTRAILAGNTGDIRVDMAGSQTHPGQANVSIIGLVKGQMYEIAVNKVKSTGTTSTMNLTGFY